MKKTIFAGIGAIALGSLIAFTPSGAAVSGKVTPPDQVDMVWAIKGTDTVKSKATPEGTFALNLNAGTWKVIIDAKSPYKDVQVEKVDVADGKPVDLGEIKLEK